MRILLVQHLGTDREPVFIGRTPDLRFHVIWRRHALGSADSLEAIIRLACKGPLQHPEFGAVPRCSARLDAWMLCTGPEKHQPVVLHAPAVTREGLEKPRRSLRADHLPASGPAPWLAAADRKRPPSR